MSDPVPYSNEYPYEIVGADTFNGNFVIRVGEIDYAISCVQVMRESAVTVAVNRGLMEPPPAPEE